MNDKAIVQDVCWGITYLGVFGKAAADTEGVVLNSFTSAYYSLVVSKKFKLQITTYQF